MRSYLSLSPGVTSTPQRVTSTSHGETGVIDCAGTLNGHEVTGSGTIGFQGFFDASYPGGTGHETAATIPTTGGPLGVTFPVDETVVPGTGFKSGAAIVGVLPFIYSPTEGDCFTTPITQAWFAGAGVLHS